MEKYKIQQMIESGQLDVSKLSDDYKENIDLIQTISRNYTVEDADARTMDNSMSEAVKETDAYSAPKAEPAETDNKAAEFKSNVRQVIDEMTDWEIDMEGEEETAVASTRMELEDALEMEDAEMMSEVQRIADEMPDWTDSIESENRDAWIKYAERLGLKKKPAPKKEITWDASEYVFHNDPGHGWLAVKRKELEDLGILSDITPYSYEKGETVYLEEDQDLTTYINAVKEKHDLPDNYQFNFKDSYKDRSPIRNYPSFNPPGKKKPEYKWPHKMDPFTIKESIAQLDKDADNSVKIFKDLSKEDEKYFYSELITSYFPEHTTIKEQKEDMEYLIGEYDKSKKPAPKKEDKKPDQKVKFYIGTSIDRLLEGWFPNAITKKEIIEFYSGKGEGGAYGPMPRSEAEDFLATIKKDIIFNKERWGAKTTDSVKNDVDKLMLISEDMQTVFLKKPAPKKEPAKESDLVLDKAIDNVIGKSIYFKSDEDNWVKGTIIDIFPANKGDLSKWKIEYNGPGGKSKWEMPLVSDTLTSDQVQSLIDKEQVKGYTLKEPKESIITDFNKAIQEIDECREMAKTERAEKQKDQPKPPKKQPATIYKDKTTSWAEGVAKIAKAQKPDDNKVQDQVKKIVLDAEQKISKLLFGAGKGSDEVKKAIEQVFKKK